MGFQEPNKEQFIKEFPTNNFNIARTCKAIGISRAGYYHWLSNDDKFKTIMEDFAQADLDQAEESLRLLRQGIVKRDENGKAIGWIMEPIPSAIFFFLKTKGKERGYIEDGSLPPSGDDKLIIEFVHEGNTDIRRKLLQQQSDKLEQGRDEEQ